jgi:hypothetical protein
LAALEPANLAAYVFVVLGLLFSVAFGQIVVARSMRVQSRIIPKDLMTEEQRAEFGAFLQGLGPAGRTAAQAG